jgi:predicted CoA-binding protein
MFEKETADAIAALGVTQSVLLVDWPSRDVPDTLAQAGFTVVAQEGSDTYVAYELAAEVVQQRDVRPPDSTDMVYAYRPLDELPDILALARDLGARAVWLHSEATADEIDRARQLVEGAGLAFISGPDIVDTVRAVSR